MNSLGNVHGFEADLTVDESSVLGKRGRCENTWQGGNPQVSNGNLLVNASLAPGTAYYALSPRISMSATPLRPSKFLASNAVSSSTASLFLPSSACEGSGKTRSKLFHSPNSLEASYAGLEIDSISLGSKTQNAVTVGQSFVAWGAAASAMVDMLYDVPTPPTPPAPPPLSMLLSDAEEQIRAPQRDVSLRPWYIPSVINSSPTNTTFDNSGASTGSLPGKIDVDTKLGGHVSGQCFSLQEEQLKARLYAVKEENCELRGALEESSVQCRALENERDDLRMSVARLERLLQRLVVGETCGMDHIGSAVAGSAPEVVGNASSTIEFVSEEAFAAAPSKQLKWCSSNAQRSEAAAAKAKTEMGTTLAHASAMSLSVGSSNSGVQPDQNLIDFSLKQHYSSSDVRSQIPSSTQCINKKLEKFEDVGILGFVSRSERNHNDEKFVSPCNPSLDTSEVNDNGDRHWLPKKCTVHGCPLDSVVYDVTLSPSPSVGSSMVESHSCVTPSAPGGTPCDMLKRATPNRWHESASMEHVQSRYSMLRICENLPKNICELAAARSRPQLQNTAPTIHNFQPGAICRESSCTDEVDNVK